MPLFKPSRIAAVGVIAGLATASPAAVAGVVDIRATMNIDNLDISFNDPNASLTWGFDSVAVSYTWVGEVLSESEDRDSGFLDDFDFYEANNADIDATAQTAQVTTRATNQVTDGENVAIDQAAGVSASTASTIGLNGNDKQADGFAKANFDNFFSVSSSNPIGSTVLATIRLDYTGMIDASADPAGAFNLSASSFLGLYDTIVTTDDVFVNDLVDFDEVVDQAAGVGTSYQSSPDGTLSIVYSIDYDAVYSLYAEASVEIVGEVTAAVPSPGSLPLLLLGVGTLAWRRRRACTGAAVAP